VIAVLQNTFYRNGKRGGGSPLQVDANGHVSANVRKSESSAGASQGWSYPVSGVFCKSKFCMKRQVVCQISPANGRIPSNESEMSNQAGNCLHKHLAMTDIYFNKRRDNSIFGNCNWMRPPVGMCG
jgi:hypothetical protein